MMVHLMRRNRLQDWMKREGLDLAIVTHPANVFYLTGFYCNPHERFLGIVVPAKGESTLIVPALEKEAATAKSQMNVDSHSDTEMAADVLHTVIERTYANPQTVGIEKASMSVARYEEISARVGGSYQDIEPALLQMRQCKDETEVSIMRKAAKLADLAVEAAVSAIEVGKTEVEIVQAIEAAIKAHGGERAAFETIVLSGEKSALPHGVPGTRKIASGDIVLVDLGVVVEGYCSDITRTFVVGEASPEQRAIYDTVLQANEAAIAAVKPGIAASEIDRAARDVIARSGYAEYFIHRVGHGLGIDVHEFPSLHGANTTPLVTGMTFTIEPGIYLPGTGGVRIEDDVLVVDGGVEVLTKFPKELMILPA
ncbi:Xaa-Pro dipeptidase [Collibacillus ludicampi]|uniref:Xaa-Pro dipeptidase n=1 Tax=Collibacillus ludicampi TaxID=2771369 RepID=A0AAV4LA77_9BACL|nr:Xaa-Pro peptidase family protein [Collibacillus ludicampi]GIM44691.1 Xaa-Pro dipeptidase [Collibacillus ludicampi]